MWKPLSAVSGAALLAAGGISYLAVKPELASERLQARAAKENKVKADQNLGKAREAKETADKDLTEAKGELLKNTGEKTEAESALAQVREAEAEVERARNRLGEFEGKNTRVEQAAAALRDAELKVSYCKIFAPCDGTVTNLQIAPGSYAGTGEQIFSLVDDSVWFVLANFRETDLRRIRAGQEARVFLMSQRDKPVGGIVQGIPKAVFPLGTSSQAAPGGEGVFSRVQPTFDFIQLAQRFPVRILLEGEGDFRMGGRAAVVVDTRSENGLERLKTSESVEEQGFTPPVGNE